MALMYNRCPLTVYIGGEVLPTGLGLDRYEKDLMTVVVLQQRKKIHNLMSEVSKQAEMLAHIKSITTEDDGGGDEEAANRKITAIKELLKDIKVADSKLIFLCFHAGK